MGRKQQLTEEEIGRIRAFAEEGYSGRGIARRINRSANVVCSFLRNQDGYGKHYKGRVVTATTERERRKILRVASNSSQSARQIGLQAGTSASVWTVRRILKSSPNLRRLRLKKKPALLQRHRSSRLEFARHHITWKEQWRSVVFTDEKRFSLDGPDGFAHYFHDLRKEQRFLARHHSRQGSLMVWGGITYNGPLELQILTGKQDAAKYINLLQRAVADVDEVLGSMSWIFQQDNAPIHTARQVTEWFRTEDIAVLEWPALSPDLNVIENLWGWLTRKVYENGKQYENVEALREGVLAAWNEIPLTLIRTLFDSMPDRLFEVIRNNGGPTHY